MLHSKLVKSVLVQLRWFSPLATSQLRLASKTSNLAQHLIWQSSLKPAVARSASSRVSADRIPSISHRCWTRLQVQVHLQVMEARRPQQHPNELASNELASERLKSLQHHNPIRASDRDKSSYFSSHYTRCGRNARDNVIIMMALM